MYPDYLTDLLLIAIETAMYETVTQSMFHNHLKVIKIIDTVIIYCNELIHILDSHA